MSQSCSKTSGRWNICVSHFFREMKMFAKISYYLQFIFRAFKSDSSKNQNATRRQACNYMLPDKLEKSTFQNKAALSRLPQPTLYTRDSVLMGYTQRALVCAALYIISVSHFGWIICIIYALNFFKRLRFFSTPEWLLQLSLSQYFMSKAEFKRKMAKGGAVCYRDRIARYIWNNLEITFRNNFRLNLRIYRNLINPKPETDIT